MARSVKELALRLTTDVSDFAKGTQDAAGDTDDLARNVEQATEKIATSFKDLTQDAQRATDAMARNSKEAFSKVSTDAAHEMGSGAAKESFGEAGGEVGAEFASNIGESLASGDLTGVARDTAAGLVGAFQGIGGPIGIGLATAAALGTAAFANMQAEAERRATNISNITSAIFDKLTADISAAFEEMQRGQAWIQFVQSFAPNGTLADGIAALSDRAKKAGTSVGEIGQKFLEGGPPLDGLVKNLEVASTKGAAVRSKMDGVAVKFDAGRRASADIVTHLQEAGIATQQAYEASKDWLDVQLQIGNSAASTETSTKNSLVNLRAIKQNQAGRAPVGTVTGGRTARN
jgi:hypothetical protein